MPCRGLAPFCSAGFLPVRDVCIEQAAAVIDLGTLLRVGRMDVPTPGWQARRCGRLRGPQLRGARALNPWRDACLDGWIELFHC